jgi:16S rRNA (cytosine1402-N4)-methyltransferase
MAQEAIEALSLSRGLTIMDATLGGGGHSSLIAREIGKEGFLIGVDRDPEALKESRSRFEREFDNENRPRIELIHARYDTGALKVKELGLGPIDGALFDLGVSSWQLDEPGRGFTFKDPDSPLDMRMDQTGDAPTAADFLNDETEEELTRVLRAYADERWAARIAKFIVERREIEPYETAGQLVDTIRAAVPAAARSKDIHPATRAFQALRIAVNSEFEALENAIRNTVSIMASGARIVVISYHSGEDRIVKNLFSLLSGKCVCPPEQMICSCGAQNPSLKILTRKPAVPTAYEISINPRSRSAKLRAAEKI